MENINTISTENTLIESTLTEFDVNVEQSTDDINASIDAEMNKEFSDTEEILTDDDILQINDDLLSKMFKINVKPAA